MFNPRRVEAAVRSSPLFRKLRRYAKGEHVRDRETTLVYVHIGKCGGESLWSGVQRSPVVRERFAQIRKIHVEKPPILSRARYLIVVRNPTARVLSAFNWRYKLVVEDAVQKDRFPGEHAILSRYGSCGALAEALYRDDGSVDTSVARDFFCIHHLRENIAFYLEDLLGKVARDQLLDVMATESLDADVARVLKVDQLPRAHSFRARTPKDKLDLSERARRNLRSFLAADYACVERLIELSPGLEPRRDVLLA